MADADNSNDTSGVLPVRRRVLNWVGGLGIAGFAASLLAPMKDLAIAARGEQSISLTGQRLVLAREYTPENGDTTYAKGEVVTDEMMTPPESLLASPERLLGNDDYLIRLHHLEEDRLKQPTKLEWTDSGYVAYSAVCTHLGCTVGWEESDSKPENIAPKLQEGSSDLCPCHLSSFNPYEGAVVMGGPAPRPVPQIAVTVADDGSIRLDSEFEGPIGGA
ncbi:MAG: ubiquinol-cytochrome c reductase iron-sulfur subunit [Halodesulfurarchaeum sp.]